MSFKPEHMNATASDFEGNNGIGRYIFLPAQMDAQNKSLRTSLM